MTTLFTIGYEGVGIDSWINILKQNRISLVVDVREKPISRKKGFSKKNLYDVLNSNNINYLHIGTLGSPSDLRSDLHATQNYPAFFGKYLCYLRKQSDVLKTIIGKASRNSTCLMCFEKDPLKCHRSVITDYLTSIYPNDVKVEHL